VFSWFSAPQLATLGYRRRNISNKAYSHDISPSGAMTVINNPPRVGRRRRHANPETLPFDRFAQLRWEQMLARHRNCPLPQGVTNSAVMLTITDQPTTQRETRSSATAT
jgi:hypothetical protein